MYQLLTELFSVIHTALGLNHRALPYPDVTDDVITNALVNERAALQMKCRADAMAGRDGTPWLEWPLDKANRALSGSHLFALRGSPAPPRFLGPLTLNLSGGVLTLFDFGIYFFERQTQLAPVLQTVASLRLSHLQAPPVYLRPFVSGAAVLSEALGCYDRVDSLSAHAFGLIAESLLPSAALRLLDTKTAYNGLMPFLQTHQLTIEWTGEQLLVYRVQQTLDRQQIEGFAATVLEIARLLRAMSAEADALWDERLAAMGLPTNECPQ